MELIEGIALSKLCDYSFGDQGGQWGDMWTSFMKDANLTNVEFVSKLFEIKKSRNYMTLFIDNIRLYKRHIVEVKDEDRSIVQSLMERSDLLRLCANFTDMKFIIFTNLEDTPIDEYIFNIIPDNVLCISAVNAVAHGGKVIPAPYGVQRRMIPQDNRIDKLMEFMKNISSNPPDLLYVSHNESSHEERVGIKDLFRNKSWAKVHDQRVTYSVFLYNLSQSKFMICPRGNAIDCHRNWEVLYMKRVPIMKRHPYLEIVFKDYPILFIDEYFEITKELLEQNDYLFQQAQEMNIVKLTLPYFYDNIIKKEIK
jgi:hypothetical protein